MALAGVARLVGYHPANQKLLVRFWFGVHAWVAGSVPCRGAYERQPRGFSLTSLFLSLFPLPFPSLSSFLYKARHTFSSENQANILPNKQERVVVMEPDCLVCVPASSLPVTVMGELPRISVSHQHPLLILHAVGSQQNPPPRSSHVVRSEDCAGLR